VNAGFRVLCSNHASVLLASARRLLEAAARARPIEDLRALPVLVPTAPVRDRLRDDLAELMGVCAGIDLLLPAEFAGRWLPHRLGVAAAGIDAAVARWRVCAALDDAPLLQAGAAGAWDARRLALAGRVTDALIRLSQWCPETTTEAWRQGRAGSCDATHPYLRRLWRAAAAEADPGEAHRALLAAVARADPADLPPVVLAVATPDLSPRLLELLAALGRRIPVQVLISQPVPGDWSDQGLAWRGVVGAEEAWPHRLLAQWGVEHRQALARLDAAGAEIANDAPWFIGPERSGDLLAALQGDLLAARPPAVRPGLDRSTLVFQRAYGPRAEVEALKHRLVGWLARSAAAGAPIPPHAVCIACPDPQRYAPVLAAVFAAPGEGPPLGVDLRAPTAEAEPAEAVARAILALLPGRWCASEVLALLGLAPVAAAWGLDGAFHARLRAWCDAADLRFAADAVHRAALGLPAEAAGTWRRGLQRLAWSRHLGADTAAVPLHAGTAPVAGLDEADAYAVDRLADLLLPLLDAAAAWRAAHPASWWAGELLRLVRHLRRQERDESDAGLAVALARWCEQIGQGGCAEHPLAADAVAAALEADDRPAPLRAGGVAVGTVAALRAHPWEIVCLLGFDDGAFPRQAPPGDVDPLVRDPVPGQSDPRQQDRAGLLDLVAGAGRALLVSWTGFEARSGEPLPPCPAIGDLLEIARLTAGAARADELIDVIGLGGDAAMPPGPWPSAARRSAAAAPPATTAPLLPATPLPAPVRRSRLAWDELARAMNDPPDAWLRRLGVRLAQGEAAPSDSEVIELEAGLESWLLRDELLGRLTAGADAEAVLERLAAEGRLPRGAWGRAAAAPLVQAVRGMLAANAALLAACDHAPPAIEVGLPDGTLVVGTVLRVHPEHGAVHVVPATAAPKHRQRAWLAGLAWRATGAPGSGLLLHLKGAIAMPAIAPDDARAALARAVDWLVTAEARPSPLYPDLVAELHEAIADGADPSAALAHAWRRPITPFAAPSERPAARRVWADGSLPACDAPGLQAELIALGGMAWTKV
jgi:exodeoxyribonuclease V gamma subunit